MELKCLRYVYINSYKQHTVSHDQQELRHTCLRSYCTYINGTLGDVQCGQVRQKIVTGETTLHHHNTYTLTLENRGHTEQKYCGGGCGGGTNSTKSLMARLREKPFTQR